MQCEVDSKAWSKKTMHSKLFSSKHFSADPDIPSKCWISFPGMLKVAIIEKHIEVHWVGTKHNLCLYWIPHLIRGK
jgi:hypothetical protein